MRTGSAQASPRFGAALAAARRGAGLSQGELARRIGTTQAAITRLETGRYFPAVRTLRRLAAALGVSFEIHGGDEDPVIHYARKAPTLADVKAHRQEILEAVAAEGARNVRVFGSVARGDARPESDVDFVVDPEVRFSLMNLSGLHLTLEQILGNPVDVVTLSDQPSTERERRVTARIRREAVPL